MKTWAKIDDDLPFNPKVRGVRIPARWTYVSSICYAAHNLTDGFIPVNVLSLLDGTKPIANELVTAGLWEAVKGGWEIHDFLKHNRARATALSLSERNSASGAKGGANRWRNAKRNASDSDSETPSEMNGEALLSVFSLCDPNHDQDPDLPENTEVVVSETLSETPKHKPVTDEWIAEQQAAHPLVNVRELYDRARNLTTWAKYRDKRRALVDRIRWAEESEGKNGRPIRGNYEAGNGNRRGDPRVRDPDLERILERARLEGEQLEREYAANHAAG